jgi:signal transduction histidine kinase
VGGDWLPRLAAVANLEAAARSAPAALPGLTPWHWALSAVPLALAVAAAAGAARDARRVGLRGWLVVAMVLFAGAQLHNLFWPVAYQPLLTTGNLLRLAFGAVAALGGVLELHRVAAERAALLTAEREVAARLRDLAALRAGFGAMVAHELGAPVAAIRHAADLLGTGPLAPPQAWARDAIERQAAALTALVADAQAAAAAEHDDFAVRPRPVPVAALLEDATAFAAALPGNHPLTVEGAGADLVRADPERVGQVLRNLLGNAAKYSPEGAPIALRARRAGGRVRIEVADRGPGIPPDDLTRIFEKFGRGRDAAGRSVPGVGLGLYLSRRIVRAHGSDLAVASAPGEGAVFAFDLEAAP